jgi:predicted negative regulator of RcsB-dependent stress response
VAKKKITRKELLKSPDEFQTLSTSAVDFFNKHVKEFKFAGMGIVVIAVIYLVFFGYTSHVNKKGLEAYNAAYDVLAGSDKPDIPDDEKARAEKLFQEVIDEYGLSKAARLAYPQIGHLQFSRKQYEEAILSYEKFAAEVKGDKEYSSLNDLALAANFEARGEFEKSISILSALVKSPDAPFREHAMYNLARLYRENKQDDKAKETLQAFVSEYATSPFLPMAKARL